MLCSLAHVGRYTVPSEHPCKCFYSNQGIFSITAGKTMEGLIVWIPAAVYPALDAGPESRRRTLTY